MAAVEEELGGAAGVLRHRCKVCGKGFHSGRSLGGHMRSHILLGEAVAAADQVDAEAPKRVPSNGAWRSGTNGAVGYGLRENPKKTRRLSELADGEEEEDGGGEHRACRECGKLFSSWKSLFGHMKSHASGAREDDDEAEEADAEEEEEMVAPPMKPPPRRRRKSIRVAAPPVPSGFEKEHEEIALCLLMLSRGATTMWNSSGREEPLEKEEPKKATAKQTHLARNAYDPNDDYSAMFNQYGADAKIKSKKRRTSHYYYAPNSTTSLKRKCEVTPAKRTSYECPGCGRAFNSYQALGGHRASHKRINTSCSAPKSTPTPEPSSETFSTLFPSASPDSVDTCIGGAAKKPAAAAEKFECPVCFRVFASGQALGGHKRSHVMAAAAACSDDTELYGSASGNAELEQEHSVAPAGSLDLNFPPAP